MTQSSQLAAATTAIYAYTYGMDTANWDLAVSPFTPTVDVDYSAVGAPKATMTQAELKQFLQGLLGKEGLRVHTAIAQVFPDPEDDTQFLAYYSVRHYRDQPGHTLKFAVFGWYRYQLHEGKISHLSIQVSAIEGDPATLA